VRAPLTSIVMWQMIRSESALARTSQSWKLYAMMLGVYAGGSLMIIALWQVKALTSTQFAVLMLPAMAIIFGSFVFGCAAIKCPSCKARWLWQSVNTEHSSGWLRRLLAYDGCPECEKRSGVAT
jgi:hypothetical protein